MSRGGGSILRCAAGRCDVSRSGAWFTRYSGFIGALQAGGLVVDTQPVSPRPVSPRLMSPRPVSPGFVPSDIGPTPRHGATSGHGGVDSISYSPPMLRLPPI